MIELQSIITCPQYRHRAVETMPMDACQYVYFCPRCTARLTPKKGCTCCAAATLD